MIRVSAAAEQRRSPTVQPYQESVAETWVSAEKGVSETNGLRLREESSSLQKAKHDPLRATCDGGRRGSLKLLPKPSPSAPAISATGITIREANKKLCRHAGKASVVKRKQRQLSTQPTLPVGLTKDAPTSNRNLVRRPDL